MDDFFMLSDEDTFSSNSSYTLSRLSTQGKSSSDTSLFARAYGATILNAGGLAYPMYSCSQVIEVDGPPMARIPPHSHPGPSRHIVLAGSITLILPPSYTPRSNAFPCPRQKEVDADAMDVEKRSEIMTYGPGDHYDIPPGTIHEARVGPDGCKKIILTNFVFDERTLSWL